jgi:hypothetical protein
MAFKYLNFHTNYNLNKREFAIIKIRTLDMLLLIGLKNFFAPLLFKRVKLCLCPPPPLPLPINYDHSVRPNQEKQWKMQPLGYSSKEINMHDFHELACLIHLLTRNATFATFSL